MQATGIPAHHTCLYGQGFVHGGTGKMLQSITVQNVLVCCGLNLSLHWNYGFVQTADKSDLLLKSDHLRRMSSLIFASDQIRDLCVQTLSAYLAVMMM